MEKQLSALGYWLGLICTVLALIFRALLALKWFRRTWALLAATPFPT